MEKNKPHILFLADGGSVHTQRWALSLKKEGFKVSLLSRTFSDTDVFIQNSVAIAPFLPDGKWTWLTARSKVKRWCIEQQVDIVHAFYATNYGLLMAVSGFKPNILTVMGTDVFSYTEKSWLHEKSTAWILSKVTVITGASEALCKRVMTIRNRPNHVLKIPFGIDTQKFAPFDNKLKSAHSFNNDFVKVIAVRHLEFKYGLDILVKAIALVQLKAGDIKISVDIYGEGKESKELQDLIAHFGLEEIVNLKGKVKPENVPGILRNAEIFVAPSREESYGVAILEASACGLPVVGSNVGGIPETIEDGVTGMLFETENPSQLADILIELSRNRDKRIGMGREGRQRVLRLFDQEVAIKKMADLYLSLKK
ncbi:MAG: glycosyltransferase family 4 protein [Balneolales bacterium]|nr:glycosyltransferase family 4 protein [Balneolales bacterium]